VGQTVAVGNDLSVMQLSITFLVVLVVLTGALEGAGQVVRFPETRGPAHAPNGAIAVVNRDDDSVDPPHALYLVSRGHSSGEKKLYSYGRHVAVTWSPDSSALAITDYVGSDTSTCIIVRVPSGSSIDLSARLQKDPSTQKYFEEDHHVYCEITRWLGSTAVAVRFHGYGDAHPKGFQLTRRYAIGSN
jgi:hypothetical protein